MKNKNAKVKQRKVDKSNCAIHIIYASTSGNTEFVVEKVADIWKGKGWDVFLHRCEQTDISLIKDNKFFLLAASTWDHGTINPFFDKLLVDMKKTNFGGKYASFIGMGDRRYEKYHFCTGMTLLKEVWEKGDGMSLGVALTIGREPFDELIDKVVRNWAETTIKLFEKKLVDL